MAGMLRRIGLNVQFEDMNESRTNEVNQVQVVPAGGSLGAEIAGLDLSQPLDDEMAGLVRRALPDGDCLLFF